MNDSTPQSHDDAFDSPRITLVGLGELPAPPVSNDNGEGSGVRRVPVPAPAPASRRDTFVRDGGMRI